MNSKILKAMSSRPALCHPPTKNFRIPYRDPLVKPEDDIAGNSRIPRTKTHRNSRISKSRILKTRIP